MKSGNSLKHYMISTPVTERIGHSIDGQANMILASRSNRSHDIRGFYPVK